MPIQKLTFKPGVNRENTRYTNEGQWWDMDKVRFRSGTPEKLGGWVLLSTSVFKGISRFLLNWLTLASENLIAVGTNSKMYVARSGSYYDITPIRYTTGSLTNPFTTGAAGSSIVTVTVASHGAGTGDFVTFSGAATVDGILAATLNAEFEITVLDANTFTIVATPCTAGSVTGGGAAVVAAFQPNVGPEINVVGTGFGAGSWGSGGWGLAATGTVVTAGMRYYAGDNFGQDLIFSLPGNNVYYWSTTAGMPSALTVRATTLASQPGASNAPVTANSILVTEDRHVVCLGTNALGTSTLDPMLVRWCAQANPVNWTPAITNTAGDERLTTGSQIMAVKKMRQENVIWTDAAVISMQFVGPPVVFSFQTLSTTISLAGANAVAVADNVAFWMGKDKFYRYDGHVQTLTCDLRKYVFSDLNATQLGQVYAFSNKQFNEVTWLYPSLSSTVIDKYVTYNYVENLWTFGTMARTAWIDTPLQEHPIAAGTDKRLYFHESGFDDGSTSPATAISAYLESADFDIGDGEEFSFIDKIIPDVDFDGSTAAVPAVTITLKSRSTPGANFTQTNAQTVSQTAVVPFQQFSEYCYVRVRGRQMAYRIESTAAGVTWQMGTPRLSIRPDGKR